MKRVPASITLFVRMPNTKWTEAQARRYIKETFAARQHVGDPDDPFLTGIVVHSVSFNTKRKAAK